MKQNVTLVVGNGVNIGLCTALDLWGLIDTRGGSIPIPHSAKPKFLPIAPQPMLAWGDLWREELWPQTFRLSQKLETFECWCKYFESEKSNLSADNNWTVRFDREGIEFRFYLYYLMYYYSVEFQFLVDNRRAVLESWPFFWIVKYLVENTNLRIISYNYDVILEMTLAYLGLGCDVAVSNRAVSWASKIPSRPKGIPLLKIHGGVGKGLYGVLTGGYPWKSRSMMIGGVGLHELSEYPPKQLMTFPDIVLPGSTYHTAAMPGWDQLDAAQVLIESSDKVIFAGWRGDGADQIEANVLSQACAQRGCRVASLLPSSCDFIGIRKSLDEACGGRALKFEPSAQSSLIQWIRSRN